MKRDLEIPNRRAITAQMLCVHSSRKFTLRRRKCLVWAEASGLAHANKQRSVGSAISSFRASTRPSLIAMFEFHEDCSSNLAHGASARKTHTWRHNSSENTQDFGCCSWSRNMLAAKTRISDKKTRVFLLALARSPN